MSAPAGLREPVEVLTTVGLRPGMRVCDGSAGGAVHVVAAVTHPAPATWAVRFADTAVAELVGARHAWVVQR